LAFSGLDNSEAETTSTESETHNILLSRCLVGF
jgi:hypothetical protein